MPEIFAKSYWCKKCGLVAQSCPTLCDTMNCSPTGSSVDGVFQARILEWVAISFSRGYSQPRDQTQVSRIQADSLSAELPGKPKEGWAPRNWCFQTVVLEKTWESLWLQRDQTSQSQRKSTLNIHCKDWCCSWNSNTLAWHEDWLIEKYPLMLGKIEDRRRRGK